MLFQEADEFGCLIGGWNSAEMRQCMGESSGGVECVVESCQSRRVRSAEWMGSSMFVRGAWRGEHVMYRGEQ